MNSLTDRDEKSTDLLNAELPRWFGNVFFFLLRGKRNIASYPCDMHHSEKKVYD